MRPQKKILTFLITLYAFFSISGLYSQTSVGINTTTPSEHAVLHLVSPENNQGLLIPKLTSLERTNLGQNLTELEIGLLVFDSDMNIFYYWDNGAWSEVSTDSGLSEVLTNGNSASSMRIIDLGNPIDPQDAVTKSYIDDTLVYINNEFYRIDTSLTGIYNQLFILDSTVTQIIETGGIQTLAEVLMEDSSAANHRIIDLASPIADLDAVNKIYVDNSILIIRDSLHILDSMIVDIRDTLRLHDILISNLTDTVRMHDTLLSTVRDSIRYLDTLLGQVIDTMRIQQDIFNNASFHLPNGDIYVGDTDDTARAVTMTGDVLIDNTGVTTIQPDAIGSTEIADGSIANTDLDKPNIPLSGFGAAAASVDIGSNLIINVANPIADQDAATKGYIDDNINVIRDSLHILDSLIVNIQDTLRMHDTLISNISDTLRMHDTLITDILDTLRIHDTLIANVRDSIRYLDTLLGQVIDTMRIQQDIFNNASFHLPNGDIYVGDTDDTARAVTMSGDVLIDNAGVTTIQPDAIGSAEITDGSIANTDLDKPNIPISGFGAATANVDMGSNLINNVADPVAAQDAATKTYVDAADATLATDISNLYDSIIEINNDLSIINDSINNYYDDIVELHDSIINYSSDITELFDSITNITSDIDIINDSLNNYYSDITNLYDSVSTINNQIDIINDSINNYYDDITELFDSVTNITNDISVINDSINNFYSDIANLYDSVSTINNNIDIINDSLTNYYADITELFDSVTNITNDISVINDSLINYYNNITELNDSINNFYSDITNLYDSVSTINNDISIINDSLTNYYSDITELFDSVTNITNVMQRGSFNLTDGDIFIGDGNDTARARTMSGDVTIDNTGVTTIQSNAVGNTEIADGSITPTKMNGIADNGTAGYVMVSNADGTFRWESKFAGGMADDLSGGYIWVGDGAIPSKAQAVDPTGDVEIASNGTTTIQANAVGSAEISDGSIANADLDKTNIPLSGFGNAAGNVSLGDGTTNYNLINVLDPTNAQDAATKNYVDNVASSLQSEVNAIETGAGLNADGTYTANAAANYIAASTSLQDADNDIDAQVKTNADAIATNNTAISTNTTNIATNATNISNVQTEVNAIETGAGLNADGTYTANAVANYIAASTSLQDADNDIDAQVKTNADAIATNNTAISTNTTNIATNATNISNVQTEVNAIETGAGLNADGTYTANAAANYIAASTSLQDADNDIDAQVKTNADAIAANNTAISTNTTNIATNATNISNVQTEVNAIETGAGLNADGTYTANAAANYIAASTSLQDADNDIDAQVKTNADAIATNNTAISTNTTNIATNATNISNVQTEVNAIETGAGLNADGTYTANAAANYIAASTSLQDADNDIDAQVKTNADAIATNNTAISTNTTNIATNATNISNVQTEVNAIETGAGLNADGTYTANAAANYIAASTSLQDADNDIDAQVKTNADAIATNNTAISTNATNIANLQLTDLSDVSSSTATSGNILIADGTDWESVNPGGDVEIAANGTTTIQANAIGSSEITDGSITDSDMGLTSTLTFEGATADANETQLSITDPTADRTITIPNASGTVSLAPATLASNNVPRWDGTQLAKTTIWSNGDSVVIGGNTQPVSYDYSFEVDGSFKTNKIYHSSDRRWKNDIETIDSALAKTLAMRGVTYKWDIEKHPEKHFSGGTQVGLIAQEVEEVFPELVNTDSKGYKAVEYANLVGVLIEAIKEQQKLIESQSAQIEELKAENENISAQVEQIETLQTQMDQMQKQIDSFTLLVQMLGNSASK